MRWWEPGNGKQRERSFKLNRDTAVAFTKTIDADRLAAARGYGSEPEPITFADYASQWIAGEPGSPGTVRLYGTMLRVHLTPVLGSRKLADLAADREGVTKLLKGPSAGTQRPAYTALSAMPSEAERSGRIGINRLRKIRLDAAPARRKLRFASHAELTALADGLADLGPMVWIMRGCGLRPGEWLGLRKSDFVNGHLRVQGQQLRTGASAPPKARKDGDFRDVPCPGYVRQVVDPMADGPLFSLPTHVFGKRFRKAADAAGLTGFRPHDLRHTFASVTLAAGAPVTDVARWLGHSNIQVTFATYSHFIPASFDTAKDALDQEYKHWAAES